MFGDEVRFMAEKSAATATASASTAPSAPGAGAAPTPERTPVLSPELSASPSFDVEAFLAGQEPTASTSETNTGAEHAGETTSEQSEAEHEESTTVESESEAGASTNEDTQTEGEESEAGSESAEGDDSAPEGLKPKAIKRFNKLLAQRDEALAKERTAQAELADLKAKLEARQDEPTPVKADADPLAAVTNDEQLEAYEGFYQQVKSWCRRNPNGGMPPKELTGGVEREFGVEEVVTNLEGAERMLEALPKRREFLQQFRAERAKARETYKPVFTPGTPESALAKTLLPRLMNFRTQADQDALLAKLVKVEMQEREERDGVARYTRVELNKTAKPAVAAKPAPKASTGTPVPPVKPTSGSSAAAKPWDRLNQTGASVDVEELMDA